MPIATHDPPGVFPPYRAYTHAVEGRGGARLETVLRTAGMDVHAPASTVVDCRLLDPRWKLEVEAMAAK